ncbi:MAG: sulfatase [Verrucomicrobia bacterium]|nr:sulfatase [Verrucomicrobiota bacterium]MDA1068866.1 sulfatase [Verrucomicrobiota bacterium]
MLKFVIKPPAILGALFVFCILSPFTQGQNSDRPNILFAIADDWGWPHASIYGDAVIKTPTFDGIAANGVLFTNAFISSPSCTPSRNAILTGQYHWRLKEGGNLWSNYPEGFPTYVQALKETGYFVGSYRKAFGPGSDGGKEVAGKKYEGLDEFLKERPKDKPFCFWFGSSDPHRTYIWESGLRSGTKLEDVEVPPFFPDNETVRTDILDYYWEVQRFDRQVGEALALLEERGELENTIVVMTGDHGWPFPRGKSNLYDFGSRVPLAIKWHTAVPENRVVTDFVSTTDLAPTFLEAAGVKILPGTTGRSLLPLLRSGKAGRVEADRDHVLTGKERHTLAQLDNPGGTPMRAIRTDHFLYIHNFKPERWPAGHPEGSYHGKNYMEIDASPTKDYIVDHKDDPDMGIYWQLSCGLRPADELYDIRLDPFQMHNVADRTEYAGTLKRLKTQLFKELEASEDPRLVGGADAFDTYEYLGRLVRKP